MKKSLLFSICTLWAATLLAQADTTGVVRNPAPRMYDVKHALEVESLFPMFFTGGYHLGLGYRYKQLRIRLSVINGGSYDAEPAGVKNSSDSFRRHYKTSPGVFVGYNVWRNLEVYTYVELHTFEIEQKSSGIKRDIHSTDFGGGISYQLFVGRHFYLQPGVHLYLRGDHSASFGSTTYNIPNVDVAPVIRAGYRFWSAW